jgi:hypothetical protein
MAMTEESHAKARRRKEIHDEWLCDGWQRFLTWMTVP